MNYINTQTSEYPVTEQDIRSANSNSSFGSPFVPPSGYRAVVSEAKPSANALTHIVREINPVLREDGEFHQQWETVELDANTKAVKLTEAQNTVWEAIKGIRDRKVQNGGYEVGGKWYHSDTFSRTQQMGLVMMGANMVAGLQWKTMDGTFVEMTPQLALDIFAAAAASDQVLFSHAEELHADVLAAQDPSVINIYVGWPVSYGE